VAQGAGVERPTRPALGKYYRRLVEIIYRYNNKQRIARYRGETIPAGRLDGSRRE